MVTHANLAVGLNLAIELQVVFRVRLGSVKKIRAHGGIA